MSIQHAGGKESGWASTTASTATTIQRFFRHDRRLGIGSSISTLKSDTVGFTGVDADVSSGLG